MNKFSAIFLSLICVETFWLRRCMSNCEEIWGLSSFLRFRFNLFYAIDLFLYPVKISKNFRGYRKRYVVWNRWIVCSAINFFPDGNLNLESHTITCSKLTIETLQQGVKYVHITLILYISLILLFLLLTLSR